MRKYKKKYNIYVAWNYEHEEDVINRESERGWQLISGKSFSHKYEYNPDVCYRYQIDYQPNLPHVGRYIQTYHEQGWEFVSKTFNGWYYFRKIYDPELPEDQYHLYTDSHSLQEMTGRWACIATVLSVIYAVLLLAKTLHFIFRPTLATLAQMIFFFAILVLFARGIFIMRDPHKKKNGRLDYILGFVLMIVLIGGGIGAIVMQSKRAHNSCRFDSTYYMAIPNTEKDWVMLNSMDVTYSDNYYLDLEISAENPVCFIIKSSTGETIYLAEGDHFEEKGYKLHLKKGTYGFYLYDFAGGNLDVSYKL